MFEDSFFFFKIQDIGKFNIKDIKCDSLNPRKIIKGQINDNGTKYNSNIKVRQKKHVQ